MKVDCDFQDVETADTFTTMEAWDEVLDVVRLREEVRKKRYDAKQTLFKREVWHGKAASGAVGLARIGRGCHISGAYAESV